MLKVTFELLWWVLYICENRRGEAALVPLNPQTSRAKSWSEMHQAPIPEAGAFSLTPVRASPVSQPSEETRGDSLHLSASHPGVLLSPVAAADINTLNLHRAYSNQTVQSLGFVSNMGSNICVAETPTNFFFNFTAHIRDVVPRMLCK